MVYYFGYMLGFWGFYALTAKIFNHRVAILLASIFGILLGIVNLIRGNIGNLLSVLVCILLIIFVKRLQVNSKDKNNITDNK